MPKRVDHDQRRVQIAEALQRLTTRAGLEGVSLRQVAAEAGMSMGSVQHYFKTKDEMLLFALEHRHKLRTERITAKVLAEGPPTPRSILRACLVEILPRDPESEADFLIGVAYFIRAVADPAMAKVFGEGTPELLQFFAGQIRQAQAAGDVPASADPAAEAAILWALADSQGSEILMGHRTPADAVSTVDYYLDRLFGA
ncbi:TetR/AcrR family transcriptional regulator [Amycolatopsis australiensis]|uniref:DNA-binding transcriptional regulator, AcrR family n=1 Tax=Amycolatopsis australiensis TaxID=546364 RepID=A0A1K1RWJ3_9PSEU|nr:TetR/AcrR family transcriptional regulator [Amycolatopsis australiensis]SFW76151.1 DNA-binding transcriptional regulator, AcrR family [Amycolatopsis australiensis]